MSIESITTKIKDEALEYSNSQKKATEVKADEIITEAKNKAEEIKNNSSKKSKIDASAIIEKKKSVAKLDSRKLELLAKQQLIDESFNMAIEKIINLDDDEYIELILDKAGQIGCSAGEMILNKKDKKRIGSKLEAKLKNINLSLSTGTADIRGGFILQDGNISYNASIEKMILSQKDELILGVSEILFS